GPAEAKGSRALMCLHAKESLGHLPGLVPCCWLDQRGGLRVDPNSGVCGQAPLRGGPEDGFELAAGDTPRVGNRSLTREPALVAVRRANLELESHRAQQLRAPGRGRGENQASRGHREEVARTQALLLLLDSLDRKS